MDMTHRFARYSVAVAVAAAISLVSLSAAPQYGGIPPVAPAGGRAGGAAPQQSVPTPRTADGHPDMSGMWGGGGGGFGAGDKPDEKGNLTVVFKQRPCSQQQRDIGECAQAVNFERDSGVTQRADANMPMYKPEFWDRVQYLDRNGVQEDPTFHCKPAGVPRMGPPAKIVQTATELVFLYGQGNVFRIIPIDGRPHDPIKSQDTTWYGDAVGKWDGDTLVIDIVGFNDESWLDWPGWLHSNNMHVIEKYTRNGNTMTWQVTVEDPDVLTQPFVMDPRTIRMNPNPKATFTEDLPCEERDAQHIVTHERG
jgi:hypothetical protein